MISDVKHLLMYLLVLSIPSLEKHLFISSAHILTECFSIFLLSCVVLYIFWTLTPYQICAYISANICKYLLLCHRLPFHFTDSFLWYTEASWFTSSPFNRIN